MYYDETYYDDELYHYGILGMKWGVRRYQNEDGTLTDKGKQRYLNDEGQLNRRGEKSVARTYNQAYKQNSAALARATGLKEDISSLDYKSKNAMLGITRGIARWQADNARKTLDKVNEKGEIAAEDLNAAYDLIDSYANTTTRALEAKVKDKSFYSRNLGAASFNNVGVSVDEYYDMPVNKISFTSTEKAANRKVDRTETAKSIVSERAMPNMNNVNKRTVTSIYSY